MTDLELRANAMLAELQIQVRLLSERSAFLAAELALAQAKVKELEDKCSTSNKTTS